MSHKVAMYWAPMHNPAPALDYIRRLQPRVIRVMTEDVQHISDAHTAAPGAIIIPRVWRIDDDNGRAIREMNDNPVAAGKHHAQQMVEQVQTWRHQATERGIPFPPRAQIIIGGANEPNAGATYPVICEYAKPFGMTAFHFDYRALLLILGSGHPATPGENWHDWSAFDSLQPVLDIGGHWVETHGYWQVEGPFHEWTDSMGEVRRDYPALAGRHHHCTLRAPHFIGECGIDGGIYDRNPRWGWQDYHIDAAVYARQIEVAHDALAKNVVGMCVFEFDHQDDAWNGFDITNCREEILAWATTKTTIPAALTNVYLPVIENGDGPTDTVLGHFGEAVEFVLDRWEGGYTDDINDPGGETNFGISKRAHPNEDIKGMTRERAIEIYLSEYWLATNADRVSWPFGLMYFDTAVLHGPGAAAKWLEDWGENAPAFAWERANVYMQSSNFSIFGQGWRRRVVDLLATLDRLYAAEVE